jgi:hypothetical protein
MKTNVKLLIAIALMASACTTGSKVTSSQYSDDVYYTPGEAKPAAPKPVIGKELQEPQKKSTVVMQVEENDKGKVVNNYVVPKSSRKDNTSYYFDNQPAYSDTVKEYKDSIEHVTVNNTYEGQEMDYSTRIRTFYDPYFYDPYWDPYWGYGYGGWGFSFGWGWGYPYYGWGYPYYGWGYPYYGWGYPYYGWGYPYYGWGYPGYGWGYPGYGGGVYYGDVHYGKQNHTGQGGSNAVHYGMNSTKNGSINGGSSTRLPSGTNSNGSATNTRSAAGYAGASATRLTNSQNSTRLSTSTQSQNNNGKSATITNLRRNSTYSGQGNSVVRQNSSSRPVSAGNSYTPTYNKPRMNTQASYNNGTSRQYSSSHTANGTTQSARYGRPQSAGGSYSGSATRTQSSGGFQRGSFNSSSTRSSGSYSNGGGTSTRSYGSGGTQSRSYSAPSYNGGGGFSGGNSGGSFGGGGGGGTRSGGGGGGGRTR